MLRHSVFGGYSENLYNTPAYNVPYDVSKTSWSNVNPGLLVINKEQSLIVSVNA